MGRAATELQVVFEKVRVVGVEDDGTVTGLSASHRDRPEHVAALVAGRTRIISLDDVTVLQCSLGGPMAASRQCCGGRCFDQTSGVGLSR